LLRNDPRERRQGRRGVVARIGEFTPTKATPLATTLDGEPAAGERHDWPHPRRLGDDRAHVRRRRPVQASTPGGNHEVAAEF
jgi:hypothetical protein